MPMPVVRFRPFVAVVLVCCLIVSGMPVRTAAAEGSGGAIFSAEPAFHAPATVSPTADASGAGVPVTRVSPDAGLAVLDAALAAAGTDRLLVVPLPVGGARIVAADAGADAGSADGTDQLAGIRRDAVISARRLPDGTLRIAYRTGTILRQAAYREPDRLRTVPESRKNSLWKQAAVTSISAAAFDHAAPDRSALEDGNRIGLDVLRARTENAAGTVIVAVLDTGVDPTHPWLADRIVDPWDVVEQDAVPQDRIEHGTHVAGIIAANTPQRVKIMPIRVFPDEEGAPDSMLVAGIYRAVTHGAKIINLSLGGAGTTSYLRKAVQYARAQGVTLVVSAGNSGHDLSGEYPAAFSEVMTVGATGRDGDLLYFSNTGDALDICAPGEKIVSALPNGRIGTESGTSMAAPLVAAAAAMLELESPDRTPDQIAALLRQNAADLGTAGPDPVFGAGEVDFREYRSNADFYVVGADHVGRTPYEALYQPSVPTADTAASTAAAQAAFGPSQAVNPDPAASAGISELKFEAGLNLYAGSRVAAFSVTLDGLPQPVPAPVAGTAVACRLDLRTLSVGPHALRIEARAADGTAVGVWQQSFSVPEYNVRIRDIGLDGTAVAQPALQLWGFSNRDGRIAGVPVDAVVRDGVWMANIDFGILQPRQGVLRVADTSGAADAPLYLRTVGRSGEKVLEPSESDAIELHAGEAIGTVQARASLVAVSVAAGIGDASARWGGGTAVGSTHALKQRVALEPQATAAQAGWSGYLLLDTADFWLELISDDASAANGAGGTTLVSGGRPLEAGATENWWYAGFSDALDAVVDIGDAEVSTLVLSDAADGATAYSLERVPEGKALAGTLASGRNQLLLPEGTYAGSIDRYRATTNGTTVVDRIGGTFATTAGTRYALSLSPSLTDTLRPDDAGTKLVHRWMTADGFDYRLFSVPAGSAVTGIAGAVLPEMILVQAATGKSLVRGGTALAATDRNEQTYDLSGVPDGTWRIVFQCDAPAMRSPVAPATFTATIRAGHVVTTGNTPPEKISDYYTWLSPGGDLEYDLTQEFSDAEESALAFSTTAGYIVDGVFRYRDMDGANRDIVITARDQAGGKASLTQEIRITDEEPVEESYQPIAEIDSIGASSWATATVRSAIGAGLVPAGLADRYQDKIVRAEFSELVVRMVEAHKGALKVPQNISYDDTMDPAVLKAASLGIVSGVGNNRFNPEGNLTREQLCVMLYNAARVLRPGMAMPAKVPVFGDAASVSLWAKTAVSFCAGYGVIQGVGAGKLAPQGTVTREQAILMTWRLHRLVP